MTAPDSKYSQALLTGLLCYLIWGLVPLYFHLLSGVPAWEIVANRIVWSVVLLLAISAFRGRLGALIEIFRNWPLLRMLIMSAIFIAANWLIYIWAIVHNHILASSLGYFMNPLVNVVLGVTVLGERLRRAQMVAVGVAAVGVAIAATGATGDLWISIALALSFGLYGLVRKQTPVHPIEGLLVETMILAPVCVIGMAWQATHGGLAYGHNIKIDAILIFSAVVTSVPLVMFAAAARHLPYATIGLIQYVAPTIVFLIATLAYREPLAQHMLIAFLFIWAALAIFSVDLVRDLIARRATT
jgi:chloramphenicol-sensitive protein RarD